MRHKPSRPRKWEGTPSGESAASVWATYWPRIALGFSFSALLVGGVLILTTAARPQPGSVTPAQNETTTCCAASEPSSTTTEETTTAASTDAQLAPADPPGTIYGAKNPELIPDEVVYRVLMLAVAEPEDATEDQKARARAKMHVANLSDADLAAFLATANQFVAQIDAIATQAAQIQGSLAVVHPDSIEGRRLSELGKQEDQALITSVGGLKTSLSIDGGAKLQAHVQNIKRKITIYPPPPNMPSF